MNFTRTKTNKNQSKKNQSKVKTAFGKPAVFSYQETMSAGRRLEGVHQGQSHCEVYGGSERLHHTKYWRAEQAWKKFERHPTSRSVR